MLVTTSFFVIFIIADTCKVVKKIFNTFFGHV